VLDVGCGSGRYCVELARRGAAQVVGLDVSRRILALAEALAARHHVADRCRFLHQDVMDFEDAEGFDIVIANGFFDYVRDPDRVFTHLRPLVRHALVASFPTRWAFRVPFRWAWLALHRCPVWFFTRTDVSGFCDRAGMTVAELIRRGPIYMVRARPAAVGEAGRSPCR
jgi:SAM-dependent methyltransferase